jgi:hypothetical protein
MVDDDSSKVTKDPIRLCHSCRMPVSALAVRCRFCGATLERPRKSDEVFTVKDLGGDNIKTYTPSANVVGALEAFAEEMAQSRSASEESEGTGRRSRVNRNRQSQAEARQKLDDALDELDPSKIDIYAVDILKRQPKQEAPPRSNTVELLGRRLFLAAAFILGLVLLYFLAEFGWNLIRRGQSPAQPVFTVQPNRAEAMLAQGVPLLEVHREALRAHQQDNSSENDRILRRVREKLMRHLETEAYCNPFDPKRISDASRDSTSASTVDFDPGLAELTSRIHREVDLFKFILTTTDTDKQEAVFRLNNSFSKESEQRVQIGDLLQDRFIVTGISSRGVTLTDSHPQAGGRRLIARSLTPVLPD